MKSVFVKNAFISSLLALVISSSSHAATEQRTTLVIGNGSMGDTTEVAMAKRPPTPDKSSFTSPTIGAEFVLIPAGTFTMGDSSDAYKVKISRPFYMQTTEVTQVQWQKVMGSNPSHFTECGGDCPVEQVSWNDVQDFIGKLNRQEGTDKYRLPTEAEWEYAARSGGKQETYAGTSSESELGNYAWYDANSGGKTHPVGQKSPNGLGLYDMSGNVWEWVLDWYGGYQSRTFSSFLRVTDPKGPSSGSQRVLRGGSWYNGASYCRAAFRRYYTPAIRGSNLGFRLARTP
ncbi:MAG: formylglycine-generating enzyme family protein [Syntrophales bacterium]|jgi:formylglycine-generating enzyme required for sulfatase activity